MKRPLSSNRSSVSKRSAKRRKKYTDREIPWEEQESLGGEFATVGEGNWPISRILAERIIGGNTYYKVEWKAHPTKDEVYKPTWLLDSDVNDDDIVEWEYQRREEEGQTQAHRPRSTKVIPDSSEANDSNSHLLLDGPVTPPSLLSDRFDSGPEIAETQYPYEPVIKIPAPPIDRHDYETLHSTSLEGHSDSLQLGSLPSTFTSNEPNPVRNRKKIKTSIESIPSTPPLTPLLHTPGSDSSKRYTRSRVFAPRRTVLSEDVESSQDLDNTFEIAEKRLGELESGQKAPSTHPARHQLSEPFEESTHITPFSPSYETPQSLQYEIPETPPRHVSRTPEVNMASRTLDASMLELQDKHVKSPLSKGITADELPNEPPLFTVTNQDDVVVPNDTTIVPLTIHESIEDEPQSPTDNSNLLDSKLNSSQESLNNEREIETVDGVMIPVLPIFGLYEYVIPLPAEGKVKSAYDEVIKIKKKAILRFIGRKGSPGTADISSKKTVERNEMQDLLQRLNDTTTHADLGLPSTQAYPLNSQENAAYADYAGSKFVMLGYLIDQLQLQSTEAGKKCSFTIFAQEGALQDLLEEYLQMKHVLVRRHDRPVQSPKDTEAPQVQVDLLASQADRLPALKHKPMFLLAFDVSFTTTDKQVQSLREQYGQDLPIIHLLITNSSEHVERCVPTSLTSNIRLKVVIRTTYLAAPNLGGEISYIPDSSDHPPDGRPMDMGDIQRAVRKSPARRMGLIADIVAQLALAEELNEGWTLGTMPELKLVQLETPPKTSRAASRTPQPRRGRTATPISRATTPISRKRLLEVDGENGIKRQRLTPVRDLLPEARSTPARMQDLSNDTHKQIAQLTEELSNLRAALASSEEHRTAAESKAQEWQEAHADVLRRYEQGRVKQMELHKENKKLNASLVVAKEREEAARTDKSNIRQQLIDVKAELNKARDEIKSAGGDTAQLEEAREEARTATSKLLSMEKSLKSTKQDFEFTRTQYQDASKRASDLASEVKELEQQVERLTAAADDSKRSLKAMNYEGSLKQYAARAEQFSLEVKSRNTVIRRLKVENDQMKAKRGVQTRGSSVQPASSPGPRSRQASPAPGHLMPLSGSRASVLRHER